MSGNLITVSEGAAMTAIYRSKKEGILAPGSNPKILPICESFGRAAFDSLLALDNCVGIRIYCAMDNNSNVKFVICGVDSNDEDVYMPGAEPSPNEKLVIEAGIRCPDTCPPESLLSKS